VRAGCGVARTHRLLKHGGHVGADSRQGDGKVVPRYGGGFAAGLGEGGVRLPHAELARKAALFFRARPAALVADEFGRRADELAARSVDRVGHSEATRYRGHQRPQKPHGSVDSGTREVGVRFEKREGAAVPFSTCASRTGPLEACLPRHERCQAAEHAGGRDFGVVAPQGRFLHIGVGDEGDACGWVLRGRVGVYRWRL